MAALTLQPARETVRSAANPPRPVESEVLAQRASTFGSRAPVSAPAVVDAGRPLDSSTRSAMEASFGRDFGQVRVHDDARAHDTARDLGARAYTAGDDIVFAEGAYRPGTPSGQALIAHELAHTVHQGGVQMKSVGPLGANADRGLEAEADRAAFDVTSGRSAPALSRVQRPLIFRANDDVPVGGTATTPAAGPTQRLPTDMTAIEDEPPGVGTDKLIVRVANFTMPAEKGFGPWVKPAYDEAVAGKRLVYSPILEGNRIASFKEGSDTKEYQSIWLRNFGFKSMGALAAAIRASEDPKAKTALANPSVNELVTRLGGGLKAARCDIDHIVEKQMGGTSIASNLQLLDHDKNVASGSGTQRKLEDLVKAIRDQSMRGQRVRNLQIHIESISLAKSDADPSFVVEELLRQPGVIKGSDEIKAKAAGTPVSLSAGGVGETVRIQETGPTTIDSMEARILPGARLTSYTRGPGGSKSKADKVDWELDSLAAKRTGQKADARLTAVPVASLPASPADPGSAVPGQTIGAAAAGAAAQENAAATEKRVLKLLPEDKKKRVAFFYPYLSPGSLTHIDLDDKGQLYGTGSIKPSIPFIPELLIKFGPGPDILEVVAPIPAAKLRTPSQQFRFRGGELSMALSPTFIPKGSLTFEIGPVGKPVIVGDVLAKYEGGVFVAVGTLKPGMSVPGVKEASGEVRYDSEVGWSGKLKASGISSIPNATISAELGFRPGKGGFEAYGSGTLSTKLRDSPLNLMLSWNGGAVAYSGDITILKPIPIVEKVTLRGGYKEGLLSLTGDAGIKWRNIDSKIVVTYTRKDGDAEGKFSGKADFAIKTEKALGNVILNYDEQGRIWGEGSISYAVNKDIRPKLRVKLDQKGRVQVFGEVSIADMALTKMWPAPAGGSLTLIKGVGGKFPVPTPVPALNLFGELRVSAGLKYGVGPVMVRGVIFDGSLYPLEDDPEVKARLRGRLVVPAFGEIWGTFGARIGAEVAGGLVGAKGGVDLTPALRIQGEGGLDVNAEYAAGTFSFEAVAFATGQLILKLRIDLVAELYAAYGALSHTWTWNVKDFQKQVGPELRLTLGKLAYKNGEITWPSLDQIKLEPEKIDPIEIIKQLLETGKSAGQTVKQ
jgi:hypothetical protein